jgi:hypothetical protein
VHAQGDMSETGETALTMAIEKGRQDVAVKLIRAGHEVSERASGLQYITVCRAASLAGTRARAAHIERNGCLIQRTRVVVRGVST